MRILTARDKTIKYNQLILSDTRWHFYNAQYTSKPVDLSTDNSSMLLPNIIWSLCMNVNEKQCDTDSCHTYWTDDILFGLCIAWLINTMSSNAIFNLILVMLNNT